ncbi:hypothetical protein A9Q87_01305 [Flavobacteriales bacterium 34_180_T64]|nr:hypothetical protein A9Q87_01305 [Flavobacteriales bacterium 34_180_T64]
MSKLEDFLSQNDEMEIVEAIRIAEGKTSGEIRVHIESSNQGNIEQHVLEVFHLLKMDNTKLLNGVLIYVAVKDKSFAIYGDKGINDVVSNDFWDVTKDVMLSYFKDGKFKQGLIEGILKTGEQLETYFPCLHDDIDELSNEISKS